MFNTYTDIVSVNDVCQMLHISRRMAYTLIKTGQLPAKKLGRIYRIRKSDVSNFMTTTT